MASKGLEELLDPPIDNISDDLEMVDYLPRGYLSVSQATTFLKCPHQWYLRYVEGKASKPNARMFEGINVHRAVEEVLSFKATAGKLPPLQLALDTFSDAFEETKPLIEDWEDSTPGRSKDSGILITRTHYQDVAPAATPIYVEKSFHIVVGDNKLPLFGKIDSIQLKVNNPEEFDPAAGKTASNLDKRIHDLKVTSDKWGKDDIKNDLQMAIYAYAEGIPDVTVDQLVKGRGKTPRPRYERAADIITSRDAAHAIDVMSGVAKQIGAGIFPKTDPSNWWCGEKWCSMWYNCRGKK